ncbi:MAG: protein translocase subunit SecD [bacterium]|nr:protein translocase subunit SecD [bacterium]
MRKGMGWKVILVLAILGVAFFYLYTKPLKLGLDLVGGMHLVLVPEITGLPPDKSKDAIERSLEVIRNRVDEFQVSEPIVQLQGQGENRVIVVELPGLRDPERARKIIGEVASLEFKLVDEDGLSKALEVGPKKGWQILKDADGKNYLVKEKAELTGEYLKDAYLSRSSESGLGLSTVVALEFDSIGARKFAKVTGENVGKQLAIVLDGKVKSAPKINTRIPDGRAVIEGSFTREEARDLAVVLRAGTLPAPVKIVENRTVGPSLGRDSVQNGLLAGIVGTIIVTLFIIAYYKFSGVVAILGLVWNMAIILGVLAGFGATLTLPGIAGLVLTIGMSVDANVLIFERIKEELRTGKSLKGAIDAGFKRAYIVIFDSNLTTLLAAFILYQFGTGPVRGFAVTVSIGILGSMFAALFLCRLVFDTVFYQKEKISI